MLIIQWVPIIARVLIHRKLQYIAHMVPIFIGCLFLLGAYYPDFMVPTYSISLMYAYSLTPLKIHTHPLSLSQYVLKPTFTEDHVAGVDSSSKLSIALDGSKYLPGDTTKSPFSIPPFPIHRDRGSEQYQGK